MSQLDFMKILQTIKYGFDSMWHAANQIIIVEPVSLAEIILAIIFIGMAITIIQIVFGLKRSGDSTGTTGTNSTNKKARLKIK